jgi:SAM-dependent methyltransferase
VLEVGCGTGKASEQFASRGPEMLCLEPSEPMATVARRNCAEFARVTVATTSFEDWPVEPSAFRLLISAQAWHWVSPDVRLPKAHESLARDGVVALFWNMVEWRDEKLRQAVDDLYERVAPDLIATRPGYPGTRPEPVFSARELEDSPLFRSIMVRRYPWTEVYSTAAYLELMTTHSGHRMLPPAVLGRLADGLAEIIEGLGGKLRLDYVSRLYLARRVGAGPRHAPGPETGRR